MGPAQEGDLQVPRNICLKAPPTNVLLNNKPLDTPIWILLIYFLQALVVNQVVIYPQLGPCVIRLILKM